MKREESGLEDIDVRLREWLACQWQRRREWVNGVNGSDVTNGFNRCVHNRYSSCRYALKRYIVCKFLVSVSESIEYRLQ